MAQRAGARAGLTIENRGRDLSLYRQALWTSAQRPGGHLTPKFHHGLSEGAIDEVRDTLGDRPFRVERQQQDRDRRGRCFTSVASSARARSQPAKNHTLNTEVIFCI